jgi:hypothetical protein
MKKDWGFSALIEVAGKRILFDTGNDRDIFAANVKAKRVDLTNLDFVVVSHRHSVERKSECEDLCAQGRLWHFWLVSAVELLSEGRVVTPRLSGFGRLPYFKMSIRRTRSVHANVGYNRFRNEVPLHFHRSNKANQSI